jgi:tetratricopeptide (TPR) repeat protein
MAHYSVRDTCRLLNLSRAVVTGLIEAGFVNPARGKRRQYCFSFQDLIVMRAARDLSAAQIPARRIARSLRRLKQQLPEELPRTGLRIAAVGDAVVVREGVDQWQADDGQYLLSFDVAPQAGQVAFLDRAAIDYGVSAEALFRQACAAEESDAAAAIAHYRRALDKDGCHAAAYANLGRLLHQSGQLSQAEILYRTGLRACAGDPLLLFNLGVLLDDLGRRDEAMAAYSEALAHDPELADAHYNLGLLYEAQGRGRDALRHLSAYRKLTG